jgi:hypothetical protein
MVIVKNTDHVWECSPLILYNEEQTMKVFVKLASMPEMDANRIIQSRLSLEKAEEETTEFIDKKIVKIEGLSIRIGDEEKPITTYKELVEAGVYHELIIWCRAAVMSERVLEEAQIKNSSPGSDTD